jgi:hypothetical protein
MKYGGRVTKQKNESTKGRTEAIQRRRGDLDSRALQKWDLYVQKHRGYLHRAVPRDRHCGHNSHAGGISSRQHE